MRFPLIACVLILTALAFYAATQNIDAKAARLADQKAAFVTNELRTELDTGTARNAAIISSLEAENLELRAAFDKGAATQAQTLKDLTAARTELTALGTDLAEARTDLTAASTDLAEARTELTAVSTDLTEARTDLAAVSTDLTEARTELTAANTDLTELRAELTAVITDLTEARTDLKAARADTDAVNAKYVAANTKLKAAELKLASAKATAATAVPDNSELEARLAVLDDSNAALRNSLLEAKATISELSQSAQDSERARSLLVAQLAKLNSEIDLSKKQRAELETAARTARLETEEAAAERTALESTVRAKDDALVTAEERIATLLASLDQEQQKASKLKGEITEFEGTVAALEAKLDETAIAESTTEEPLTEDVAILNEDVRQAIDQCNERTSDVFVAQQIMFEEGTDALSISSIPQLEELASVAVECSDNDLELSIIVHEPDGGDTLGDQLGNDRASAVRNFLGARGFSQSAMRIVSSNERRGSKGLKDDEAIASTGEITFDWQPN